MAAETIYLSREQIHEVAGCVALAGILKHGIEIRRRAQRIEKRPKGKTFAAIRGKSKVDDHSFDARLQGRWRNRAKIGGPEIAADLIVEIHAAQAVMLGGPRC